MSMQEEKDSLQARAQTYSFLSALFLKEVTYDFLEQAAQNPPIVDGELGQFFTALSAADIKAVRRDVVAEFSALLLNMSADPVFPYESVYTSDKQLMMQQARDQVLNIYRREGFSVSDGINIPEDHVGIEFEFMARMCLREWEALQADDIDTVERTRLVQKEFLQDHLLCWVPQMCEDLARRAKTRFYRGLAQTTQTFLLFEKEAHM